MFTFAAVTIDDLEAYEIISEARAAHPVQMAELKAGQLLKSATGIKLMERVLERTAGRFRVVGYDKVLALAGKLFEYVYEPVLKHDPGLVYQKDLHRFVAMYAHLFFTLDDIRGEEALRQFERYMRTLDPASAPLLFEPPAIRAEEAGDPYAATILTFSRACRDIIVADTREAERVTPDRGKWLLDLAVSSLWSLLNEIGEDGQPLAVVCDDSKPLQAQTANFVDEALAFAQARAEELLPNRARGGFKLAGPIAFGDSRGHPGLQIADIAAGSLNRVLVEMNRGDGAPPREDLRPLADLLLPAMSQSSIMPDLSLVDIEGRAAAANWAVLNHMSDAAVRGVHPRLGLEDVFRAAEELHDRSELLAQ